MHTNHAPGPENTTPKIVGHRGASRQHTENTLPALEAAVHHGADAVELDIQYTRLGEPLVFHDADLWRIADRPERVRDLCAAEVRGLVAAAATRRPGCPRGSIHVPDLAEAVDALAPHPIEVFVEIKADGVETGNIEDWVAATVDAARPLKKNLAVISFNRAIVRAAQLAGAPRIGWIIEQWTRRTRETAGRLQPDLLVASTGILPRAPAPLWRGGWQWMIYEVNDAARTRLLHARGADYIETADPEALIHALRPHGEREEN